jgi:hypothetical protein
MASADDRLGRPDRLRLRVRVRLARCDQLRRSKAVGMDNVFSLAHGVWVHFEDQALNWLELFGRLCANGSGS